MFWLTLAFILLLPSLDYWSGSRSNHASRMHDTTPTVLDWGVCRFWIMGRSILPPHFGLSITLRLILCLILQVSGLYLSSGLASMFLTWGIDIPVSLVLPCGGCVFIHSVSYTAFIFLLGIPNTTTGWSSKERSHWCINNQMSIICTMELIILKMCSFSDTDLSLHVGVSFNNKCSFKQSLVSDQE